MSDSWSEVAGLAAGTPRAGDTPAVSLRQHADGASMIQITFTAGQRMPDHSAPKPIVLLGQRGTVSVEVDGAAVTVEPGVALRIETREPHSLTAVTDADVTLLLLG